MNKWTHSLCDDCWLQMFGAKTPFRVEETEELKCCECGNMNKSGIIIRGKPEDFSCGGIHES